MTPVIFSPRVLNTLQALPEDERSTIAAALTTEFLLGHDAMGVLSPLERLVYAMIRRYVQQDMARAGTVTEVYDFTR